MATVNVLYKGDSEYWKAYREGRPSVPDSYFERILEYHVQNGGRFNVLHEIGAGSAVHTGRIAPTFKETIVSDPGAENIRGSQILLGRGASVQVSSLAKAEETSDIEPESVDLIFGANMMRYTDLDDTLQAVIHQLRPGGTVALAGFGYVILLNAKLQELWTGMVHRILQFLCERNDRMLEVVRLISSPYDSVAFDPCYFRPGAQRIKLNERNGWIMRKLSVSDSLVDTIQHVQRFGKDDKIIRENNEDWNFDADITLLRKILDTYPIQPDAILDERWREF